MESFPTRRVQRRKSCTKSIASGCLNSLFGFRINQRSSFSPFCILDHSDNWNRSWIVRSKCWYWCLTLRRPLPVLVWGFCSPRSTNWRPCSCKGDAVASLRQFDNKVVLGSIIPVEWINRLTHHAYGSEGFPRNQFEIISSRFRDGVIQKQAETGHQGLNPAFMTANIAPSTHYAKAERVAMIVFNRRCEAKQNHGFSDESVFCE